MKNVRILFALLLCTSLFYSCTADDVMEEVEVTSVLEQDIITARDGESTSETGGDEDAVDDDVREEEEGE